MTALVWGAQADRRYESGVDRGVLYVTGSDGVAWNGLVSITEKVEVEIESLYFAGIKYNDFVNVTEYKATLEAYTYPDEFAALEGVVDLGGGMFATNQHPGRFGLSYRSMQGDSLGPIGHYKVHVLYNMLATQTDRPRTTVSSEPAPSLFSWELTSVPVEISGYSPTSHVIFDTRHAEPEFIQLVEDVLYGSSTNPPFLPPFPYFTYMQRTWGITPRDDMIQLGMEWGRHIG